MPSESAKDHWEKVYATKQPHEVSWTEAHPEISLDFIHGFKLTPFSSIIDIGGGDSKLVDHLLAEGFQDITVLDISAQALARAQSRLGEKGKNVKWVVADVTEYRPIRKFDVWHDRATFHFITSPEKINEYAEKARTAVTEGGFLVLGTFSMNGPRKCSGLEIRPYSEGTLEETFRNGFRKLRCITKDHETPFHTTQNFLYCGFQRV